MKPSRDYFSSICYALFIGIMVWRVGVVAYDRFVEWHHEHYIGVDESHPIILKDNFWPNHGQSYSPLLKDRKYESLLGPTGDNTMKGLLGPLPNNNEPRHGSLTKALVEKESTSE